MQQPKDKLGEFYNALKTDGVPVPESVDVFKSTLSDPAKAEGFYNALKTDGVPVPESYDAFASGLGLKKKGQTPSSDSTDGAEGGSLSESPSPSGGRTFLGLDVDKALKAYDELPTAERKIVDLKLRKVENDRKFDFKRDVLDYDPQRPVMPRVDGIPQVPIETSQRMFAAEAFIENQDLDRKIKALEGYVAYENIASSKGQDPLMPEYFKARRSYEGLQEAARDSGQDLIGYLRDNPEARPMLDAYEAERVVAERNIIENYLDYVRDNVGEGAYEDLTKSVVRLMPQIRDRAREGNAGYTGLYSFLEDNIDALMPISPERGALEAKLRGEVDYESLGGQGSLAEVRKLSELLAESNAFYANFSNQRQIELGETIRTISEENTAALEAIDKSVAEIEDVTRRLSDLEANNGKAFADRRKNVSALNEQSKALTKEMIEVEKLYKRLQANPEDIALSEAYTAAAQSYNQKREDFNRRLSSMQQGEGDGVIAEHRRLIGDYERLLGDIENAKADLGIDFFDAADALYAMSQDYDTFVKDSMASTDLYGLYQVLSKSYGERRLDEAKNSTWGFIREAIVMPFIEPIYNTVEGLLVDVPNVVADLIEGDERGYSPLRSFYETLQENRELGHIQLPQIAATGFITRGEDGDVPWYMGWTSATSQGLGSVATFMTGGGIGAKATKELFPKIAAKTATNIGSKVGITATGFAQMTNGLYQESLAAGLDTRDAAAISLSMSLVLGYMETLVNDYTTYAPWEKGFKDSMFKSMAQNYGKKGWFKPSITTGAAMAAWGGAGEGKEELLIGVSEGIIKFGVNLAYGEDLYDLPDATDIGEQTITGFVTGGITKGGGFIANSIHPRYASTFLEVVDDAERLQSVTEALSKTMTTEEFTKFQSLVNTYKGALDGFDVDAMDEVAKMTVADAVVNIGQMEEQIKRSRTPEILEEQLRPRINAEKDKIIAALGMQEAESPTVEQPEGELASDVVEAQQTEAFVQELEEINREYDTYQAEVAGNEVLTTEVSNALGAIERNESLEDTQADRAISTIFSEIDRVNDSNLSEANKERITTALYDIAEQIDNYDFRAKVGTVEVAESVTVTDTRRNVATQRAERYFEGQQATDGNGNQVELTTDGERVVVRKQDGTEEVFDTPSMEATNIAMNEDGTLGSVTMTDRFGTSLTFEGDVALDLAIRARTLEVGDFPSQTFNEIVRREEQRLIEYRKSEETTTPQPVVIEQGDTAQESVAEEARPTPQERGVDEQEAATAEGVDAGDTAVTGGVENALKSSPKNIRNLYNVNRKLFGLDRAKSLASAIVMDRMIGQMAKRGGMPKSQMYSRLRFEKASEKEVPVGVLMQIDAFHGSPYLFDSFTTDKIGTGEGAQAFGWGLYFTDLEGIARAYANKLGKQFMRDWYAEDYIPDNVMSVLSRLYGITEYEDAYPLLDAFFRGREVFVFETDSSVAEYEALGKEVFKDRWAMYKVSIDTSPENKSWIEWFSPVDLTLKNKITKGLASFLGDGVDLSKVDAATSGQELYTAVGDLLRGQPLSKVDLENRERGRRHAPSDEIASVFLSSIGVDGVKYPAESASRGATTETARGFNYVVFDENAVSIKEVVRYQKDAQKARGAVMVGMDGNAVIYALTDPNVSTPLHELAHVFEHYLTDAERKSVMDAAGTKEWNTQTSEYFARGFERYLADGVAPSSALGKLFERFKTWLTEIYNGIKGSDIDVVLNSEMRSIYAKMLGEDVVAKAEGVEAVRQRALENSRKLREQLDKFGRETAGMNIAIPVVKGALKAFEGALTAGKSVAEALDAAIAKVRSYKWYNTLSQDQQQNVEQQLTDALENGKPVRTNATRQDRQRITDLKERISKMLDQVTASPLERTGVTRLLNLSSGVIGKIDGAFLNEFSDSMNELLDAYDADPTASVEADITTLVDTFSERYVEASKEANLERDANADAKRAKFEARAELAALEIEDAIASLPDTSELVELHSEGKTPAEQFAINLSLQHYVSEALARLRKVSAEQLLEAAMGVYGFNYENAVVRLSDGQVINDLEATAEILQTLARGEKIPSELHRLLGASGLVEAYTEAQVISDMYEDSTPRAIQLLRRLSATKRGGQSYARIFGEAVYSRSKKGSAVSREVAFASKYVQIVDTAKNIYNQRVMQERTETRDLFKKITYQLNKAKPTNASAKIARAMKGGINKGSQLNDFTRAVFDVVSAMARTQQMINANPEFYTGKRGGEIRQVLDAWGKLNGNSAEQGMKRGNRLSAPITPESDNNDDLYEGVYAWLKDNGYIDETESIRVQQLLEDMGENERALMAHINERYNAMGEIVSLHSNAARGEDLPMFSFYNPQNFVNNFGENLAMEMSFTAQDIDDQLTVPVSQMSDEQLGQLNSGTLKRPSVPSAAHPRTNKDFNRPIILSTQATFYPHLRQVYRDAYLTPVVQQARKVFGLTEAVAQNQSTQTRSALNSDLGVLAALVSDVFNPQFHREGEYAKVWQRAFNKFLNWSTVYSMASFLTGKWVVDKIFSDTASTGIINVFINGRSNLVDGMIQTNGQNRHHWEAFIDAFGFELSMRLGSESAAVSAIGAQRASGIQSTTGVSAAGNKLGKYSFMGSVMGAINSIPMVSGRRNVVDAAFKSMRLAWVRNRIGIGTTVATVAAADFINVPAAVVATIKRAHMDITGKGFDMGDWIDLGNLQPRTLTEEQRQVMQKMVIRANAMSESISAPSDPAAQPGIMRKQGSEIFEKAAKVALMPFMGFAYNNTVETIRSLNTLFSSDMPTDKESIAWGKKVDPRIAAANEVVARSLAGSIYVTVRGYWMAMMGGLFGQAIARLFAKGLREPDDPEEESKGDAIERIHGEEVRRMWEALPNILARGAYEALIGGVPIINSIPVGDVTGYGEGKLPMLEYSKEDLEYNPYLRIGSGRPASEWEEEERDYLQRAFEAMRGSSPENLGRSIGGQPMFAYYDDAEQMFWFFMLDQERKNIAREQGIDDGTKRFMISTIVGMILALPITKGYRDTNTKEFKENKKRFEQFVNSKAGQGAIKDIEDVLEQAVKGEGDVKE